MTRFAKFLTVSLLALMPLAATAAEPAGLTDQQKAEVEQIVRELLTKKDPNIVMEAARSVQEKMEAESAAKGKKAIGDYKDKIFNDPNAPVGGNPKGDVTLVEFFDYQCGYCKTVHPMVVKLLQEDKNLRFVYKEYPILGDGSVLASRAALASVKQGKYFRFHEALMEMKGHVSEDGVMQAAKDVGLDLEKLKKDMASDAVEKILAANREMGMKIGANGTPTFVIGDNVFPGAVPLEQMKKVIEDVRKNQKK